MIRLYYLVFLVCSNFLLYTSETYSQIINTDENNTQKTTKTNNDIQVPQTWYETLSKKTGLFAKFNFGDDFLIIDLYYQHMPISVMYFVGLASARFNQQSTIENTQMKQQNNITIQTTTNITKTTLPDQNLYNNGKILSYTPDYTIYANIHENSAAKYKQYTFIHEKYFNPIQVEGKGFLALYGLSLTQISSRIIFILSDIETFSLSVPIIGNILYEHSSFDPKTTLNNIDSVEIQATNNRAKKFLKSITWENFQQLAEKENSQFIETKQQNISMITQQLNEKTYRKSTSGLFFEFRTGKITDNIENITVKGNDINQLLSILTKDPINIADIENNYLKEGNTIHFDYTMRTYNNNKNYIDNSFKRENSMTYIIGKNKILKGIEQLFTIMSPNQTVYALIPPNLAYGNSGLGNIITISDFIEVEISMLSEARTSINNKRKINQEQERS